MSKSDMMANLDDVFTDRALSRRGIEDHLNIADQRPCLYLDRYVCLATGGSSGLRGTFAQTLDEYFQGIAALVRARFSSGPAHGRKVAVIAAASFVHSSAFGPAVSRTGPTFTSVPATWPIPKAVQRLNSLMPTELMGYPSRLASLAAEQAAERLRIRPDQVTSISEPLSDDVRAQLKSAFAAPIVDRFACTEGLVGESPPDSKDITLAEDVCIVELVDEHNRPVPAGTPSEKVLLTNLVNLTQPLIRYELEDRMVETYAEGHSSYRTIRIDATGTRSRRFGVQSLRFGSIEVHPHVIDHILMTSTEVAEYQVRRVSDELQIDVVTQQPRVLDQESLSAALVGALRQAGVVTPRLRVAPVSRLERDPISGKTVRFV